MGVLEKTVTGEFRLLKTVILTDKSVTCFNFTVVLIYFTSQSESLLCARKCFVDIRNSSGKRQATFDLVELIMWGGNWKERNTEFNTKTGKTRP